MSKQTKASVVFVQGIWADGSSFSRIIPTLQAEGHEVIAALYGLDTLAGDITAAKSALGRVSSPAILVGHSYGGTIITAAGTDPRVAGLVYIAALAPDADETSQSHQAKFPVTHVFFPRRSRGWTRVDAPRRRQVLRGRPTRAGAEARLDHAAPAADLFTKRPNRPLKLWRRPEHQAWAIQGLLAANSAAETGTGARHD
jgi:pimeloyl-ACP methyl ester carboxylesterase